MIMTIIVYKDDLPLAIHFVNNNDEERFKEILGYYQTKYNPLWYKEYVEWQSRYSERLKEDVVDVLELHIDRKWYTKLLGVGKNEN